MGTVSFFISSRAQCLARSRDGLNKVSSKSSEGFDESTSSSVWINRVVTFTCSREERGPSLNW